MQTCTNAVIDPVATGHNIRSLRQERGLSVKDLQHYFNFDEPRAIYKWQSGQSLPSIDNLYALSALFDVPMDNIIIGVKRRIDYIEPQDTSCGSVLFCPLPDDHSPSAGIGISFKPCFHAGRSFRS